ncbi:MAG: hypothetical protein RLY87_2751 [Chloroflexota bacterium]|jgi:hypothetical protein
MRFHRVRMHDVDDPQYRAYIAGVMATRSNHKAIRPASNRSLFGAEAEEILRTWLAQFAPLSANRYVEYNERMGTQLIRKYRELDAVHQADATHVHVYEVKASGQLRSINRGLRQLSETRTILRRIIPHVACTLLLVDTGIITAEEVSTQMQSDDPPLHQPATLADFVRDHPELPFYPHHTYQPRHDEATAVVTFGLNDIVAMAGVHAESLHLDWSDEHEEASDEEDVAPVTTHYSSHDTTPDEDDSPFAAAMRKANDQTNRR